MDALNLLLARLDRDAALVLQLGVAAGLMLAVVSVGAALRGNPAAERIARGTEAARDARRARGLLRETVATPRGLMRAVLPREGKETDKLRLKLLQAGFTRPGALQIYMLVRVFVGFVVPLIFLALVMAARTPGLGLPDALAEPFAELSHSATLKWLAILVGVGYFTPSAWLDRRVRERQRRIEEAFPNALDLMQVSVDTGLGFDLAMTRVGNELASVSPEIAFEFLSTQHQIQAGRAREDALDDMAGRTGVEVVRSFARVVQQSMRFGTPMSEALTTYANEMRDYREMRAQEMANKLPVKMSAVLASLMLPALIMITIGPNVIRYIRLMSH